MFLFFFSVGGGGDHSGFYNHSGFLNKSFSRIYIRFVKKPDTLMFLHIVRKKSENDMIIIQIYI